MGRKFSQLAYVFIAAVAFTTGCHGSTSTGEADDGTLCIESVEPGADELEQDGATVQDGATLKVTVTAARTLYDGCDLNLEAVCERKLVGNTIVVSTSFSWDQLSVDYCTGDGARPTKSCEPIYLSNGVYTLQWGERTEEITVSNGIIQEVCLTPFGYADDDEESTDPDEPTDPEEPTEPPLVPNTTVDGGTSADLVVDEGNSPTNGSTHDVTKPSVYGEDYQAKRAYEIPRW